jgi:hypothetical protein
MIFSSAASLDYTVIGSKAAILQNALNWFFMLFAIIVHAA